MQVHYVETTVTIRQENMPATLWLPQTEDRIHAGVVYVHGSGDGSEDEVRIEAERFASKGIAFLTVQKVMDGYTRAKRNYELLANDSVEAGTWLRNRPGMRDVPIGLLGFSEGGWVAPIAAARHPDLFDFLVLESGAIVPPGEQIRHHRAAETSSLPLYRRIFARLYTEFAVLVCDYAQFDTRPHLAKISQPIYAVWGSNDHSIPIARAKTLLQKHSSVRAEIAVIEGEPHYLNPEGDWLTNIARWILALPRD